jgi:hypothetical protein
MVQTEKIMVDVVMKMKFSINKYSQLFNRAGPGYRGMAKFIITDQHVGFLGKGYNFNFTDAELHIFISAPTFYRVNVRLQYISVFRIFYGSVDFDIVIKKEVLRVSNCIT